MKTEKPLSEKVIKIPKGTYSKVDELVIFPEDVAKAVEKLKEEIFTPNNKSKTFIELVDLKLKIKKIFGEFK